MQTAEGGGCKSDANSRGGGCNSDVNSGGGGCNSDANSMGSAFHFGAFFTFPWFKYKVFTVPFFFNFLKLFYVHEYFAYIYLCIPHVLRGKKGVSDSL